MRVGNRHIPILYDGTYIYNGAITYSGLQDGALLDASPTYLAQYANSPVITGLIDAINEWIDPGADLDNFYNLVWNAQTAQGFGLDIWGRIVDVPRQILIPDSPEYLGFEEGEPGSFPFDQRPFYAGATSSRTYQLGDDAYRVLIMTKALANISSFTAPSVNNLLRYLFKGRGSCYVLEISPMQIEYVFNFALESWEAAVLLQPTLMPRPAGVGVTITVNP